MGRQRHQSVGDITIETQISSFFLLLFLIHFCETFLHDSNCLLMKMQQIAFKLDSST